MKKLSRYLFILLICAVCFFTGYWINNNSGSKPADARRISYYVDPMNPAFKSDKPGIAPCGMALEPVYADKSGVVASSPDPRLSLPPGTIRISAEKQQSIGVNVLTVEKAPWSHTLRVLGRVTPDEALVYVINSSVEGWIRAIYDNSTGSIVKENEILASFYSPEFLSAEQAYIFALGSLERFSSNTRESPQQLELTKKNIQQYEDSLRNIGMSDVQIAEIGKTRQYTENIQIRSPAKGFVIARNVTTGLRFEKGKELYRIADLSRVWIQADLFENEASLFQPGMQVKVELPYQKKTLSAKMSKVLPQFDPATRTLKMRLVAENPDYALRPDMFVNVELPVSGPPAIIIPVDAVLDSGLKKTVFIDRGGGFFEPRQVETGRLLGERVEIRQGLMPGEKIVIAGNFMIDSEMRMQQASAGITGKIGRCPVCGMNVDEDSARAAGNYLEYGGRTYFFCDSQDRDKFIKEPERYLKSSPAARPQDAAMMEPAAQNKVTVKQGSTNQAKASKAQDHNTKAMH